MVVSTEEEGDSFFTGFLEGLLTDVGKLGTGLLGGFAASEIGLTDTQTAALIQAKPVTAKATTTGGFPGGNVGIAIAVAGAAAVFFFVGKAL